MPKTYWPCAIAVCFAVAAVRSVSAESYYVGETLPNGGVVSAVDDESVSVVYDITKMTYMDSYYNNDEFGAATTVKNVVNGSNHTGASVTRSLIGFSPVDSLNAYATSFVVLSLACTRNTDSNWSVRAYALTQAWTEGTSVSGGQTRWGQNVDGATWSTLDGTTSWGNTSGTYTAIADSAGNTKTIVGGGGSYDASACADAISTPLEGQWTAIDITNIWSQASSYGVVLMNYALSTGVAEDQSASVLDKDGWVTEKFAADDWVASSSGEFFANVDASPYLTVAYAAVPEPNAATMLIAMAIGYLSFHRLQRRRLRKKGSGDERIAAAK